jgi:hypothetical protein
MSITSLIGLVGYKGAGKSSVSRSAIYHPATSRIALPIHLMNFMLPIQDMLTAIGIPDDIVRNKSRWNEPLPILCGKTTRFAATSLGTEWGRDMIGPDLWANIAIGQVHELVSRGISVIIDNVRFPNEFELLREQGAQMIAWHRPGLIVDLSHESERHIAKLQRQCDERFDNINGEFAATVDRWRVKLKELTT